MAPRREAAFQGDKEFAPRARLRHQNGTGNSRGGGGFRRCAADRAFPRAHPRLVCGNDRRAARAARRRVPEYGNRKAVRSRDSRPSPGNRHDQGLRLRCRILRAGVEWLGMACGNSSALRINLRLSRGATSVPSGAVIFPLRIYH